MLGWLAQAIVGAQPQCELLFCASRDGWDWRVFHSRCDNKGATLTVVREREHGYVFGGYADAPWHSRSGRIGSGGARGVSVRAAVPRRPGADADGADGEVERAGDVRQCGLGADVWLLGAPP